MSNLEQREVNEQVLGAVNGGNGIDYDTGKYIQYTVKDGDSLKGIAARFGCDWVFLFELNHGVIHNPDHIQAGWTLRIPQE